MTVTDRDAAQASAGAHHVCDYRFECLIAFLEGFRALYQIESKLYLLPYFRETLLLDIDTIICLCVRLREWAQQHRARYSQSDH
ncbi:hypothetical protein AB0D37_43930 [Streptomyces sp. NPDC048384]|uniref:hypothetical protein n=1 Tax=Streptomyces sp. NPDC048384 TaxID=3155487 RepID=UPI00342A853C